MKLQAEPCCIPGSSGGYSNLSQVLVAPGDHWFVASLLCIALYLSLSSFFVCPWLAHPSIWQGLLGILFLTITVQWSLGHAVQFSSHNFLVGLILSFHVSITPGSFQFRWHTIQNFLPFCVCKTLNKIPGGRGDRDMWAAGNMSSLILSDQAKTFTFCSMGPGGTFQMDLSPRLLRQMARTLATPNNTEGVNVLTLPVPRLHGL